MESYFHESSNYREIIYHNIYLFLLFFFLFYQYHSFCIAYIMTEKNAYGQSWLDQVTDCSGHRLFGMDCVCGTCKVEGAWFKLNICELWPREDELPLCINPPSIPPSERLAIAPLALVTLSAAFNSLSLSISSRFFICLRSFARRFWNQIFTYNMINETFSL